METAKMGAANDGDTDSDPTYEAWKLPGLTWIPLKDDKFRSYLRGMETLPKSPLPASTAPFRSYLRGMETRLSHTI